MAAMLVDMKVSWSVATKAMKMVAMMVDMKVSL